jgi:importin-7
MLPCLDNFISYGKDVFIQRPDYRAMAVDIYTTSMGSEHLGENDRVNGSKIAESLLLNLRGHIDDVRPALWTVISHSSMSVRPCQPLSPPL